MLSHYGMVANLCQLPAALRITDGDTLIAVLPFFHIYGQHVIMNMGCTWTRSGRRGNTHG